MSKLIVRKCLNFTLMVLVDNSEDADVKVFLNAVPHVSGTNLMPALSSMGTCFARSVRIQVLTWGGSEKMQW